MHDLSCPAPENTKPVNTGAPHFALRVFRHSFFRSGNVSCSSVGSSKPRDNKVGTGSRSCARCRTHRQASDGAQSSTFG
eukprot:10745669-Lingulodinium_polyedra.AAC.1